MARTSEYYNVFPSLLAKYRITPNFEFQAGANKAISRPPIGSLTGLWNIVEDVQRVESPNAHLKYQEYGANWVFGVKGTF